MPPDYSMPDAVGIPVDDGDAATAVAENNGRLLRAGIFGSQFRYVAWLASLLVIWWIAYDNLASWSRWLTYDLLHFAPGTHLAAAVEFFIFELPKVMLLLLLVVFGVGVIRSFFTPQKVRMVIARVGEPLGHVLAASLGIVTPFCSCSAVPLFMGFLTAGVPLGVTFSFLVSAPMVNEVALALLWGLFGWKVAAIYVSTGLAVALATGFVISRLRMERYLEGWVLEIVDAGGSSAAADGSSKPAPFADRVQAGMQAVREIIGRVWPYVVAGIAVGAGIHGWVPQDFLAGIMGKGAWWGVPVAVLIGIPMYSNAAGIIPVVQALVSKGAAFGTVLAFMMAVIAISPPEMVLLRKVLKLPLIAVFTCVVTVGIVLIGYLFNAIL
jgi:uncharacterized protein